MGWTKRIPHLLVNGDSIPKSKVIEPLVAHRFRLINIGVAGNVRFSLRHDGTVVQWKPLAKDGADLSSSQKRPRRAVQGVMVGETYDFEFEPRESGGYALLIESLNASGAIQSSLQQRIDVR